MLYSVLTQQKYISFLATYFGFYKIKYTLIIPQTCIFKRKIFMVGMILYKHYGIP